MEKEALAKEELTDIEVISGGDSIDDEVVVDMSASEDRTKELDPKELITVLTVELAKAREASSGMLRLQADFDNFRKRTREQNSKIREDATADVLAKFLPIVDVVNQALLMITDEKVAEGVGMIARQITDILTNSGVTEIEALGKEFDPMLHSAMMQVNVNNPDQIGQVIEVFQKGYAMGDKVLRHSVVKVGC